MQKSFSIVKDDESDDEMDILARYSSSGRKNPEMLSLEEKRIPQLLNLNDSDTDDLSPSTAESRNAGPSGRQTVLRNRPTPLSSDSDDSDGNNKTPKSTIPTGYDPKLYEDLDVNDDAKEVFQYIAKYVPQVIGLEYRFKPFVPEFLPAVGDIDAFLKIAPPAGSFRWEEGLGLSVLDEPIANQSDSALLHLQLRAESVSGNGSLDNNMIVKRIDNVEKDLKVIEKWIKDISILHKSKSSPNVRYPQQMPDLDDLLQEWSEEMEKQVKNKNFLNSDEQTLNEYIAKICNIFNIPLTSNKLYSLHLLFSLYAAVKSSQLFKNEQINQQKVVNESNNGADQLILE